MLNRISRRGLIVYAHDIVMAGGSFALALYLRLGDSLYNYSPGLLVQGTFIFMGLGAGVFWFMGLYRGVWRYASLNDLMAITRAATLVILLFLLVMFLWTRLDTVPRSTLVINWFVLMALLGGPRFVYRLVKDRRFDLYLEDEDHPRVPVLLVGAGDGAELFIRSLGREDANYRVVGIVAADRNRVGRDIRGVEVLGAIDGLEQVVADLRARGDMPQRLILTRDDMDGAAVGALLDRAGELGMVLSRIPKLTEFKSGLDQGTGIEVKPVAVEDLLGRPQAALDRAAMRGLIEGRRILVTGAGGSIGSELVRQVTDLAPAEIALLDNSEFNLYAADMETAERHPDLARRALLADVRDRARLEGVFAEFRPELVFHAAALKHVPLVEANIFEGALTNVVGTATVADCCRASGVAAMVLISTDKAVNPTSVMGATKRLAECYCQALDLERHNGGGTRFLTVRFGNVLGSTGSVVPLFQRQLARGGPLTVTHPDMTRYFMTVREAVELVLQTSAFGAGDFEEDGKIFVLDMGAPVRILDLAKQMIRLAGLRPGDDVEIEFIGPRPGEKLFEEMFHGAEQLVPTACPGVLLAAPRAAGADELGRAIPAITAACANADEAALTAVIQALVPEYKKPGAETPEAATA